MTPKASLRAIKILHTVVWVFFVACIVAIPLFSFKEYYKQAALLVGVVFIEVLVLVFNRLRCPLTDVAAKYTEERRDNFDIYLPLWVARYNKHIFGLLYVIGILFLLAKWTGWIR